MVSFSIFCWYDGTMIRTQIQLTDEQARKLRELAAAEGRSVADLVRELVDRRLQHGAGPDPDDVRRRALAVVGRFRSGCGDLAEEHDRHLAEGYGR